MRTVLCCCDVNSGGVIGLSLNKELDSVNRRSTGPFVVSDSVGYDHAMIAFSGLF
jgi:hypothetical protein